MTVTKKYLTPVQQTERVYREVQRLFSSTSEQQQNINAVASTTQYTSTYARKRSEYTVQQAARVYREVQRLFSSTSEQQQNINAVASRTQYTATYARTQCPIDKPVITCIAALVMIV